MDTQHKMIYRVVFAFMAFVMGIGYILLLLQGTPTFNALNSSGRGTDVQNKLIADNRELLNDDNERNDTEAYQSLGAAYSSRAQPDPENPDVFDERQSRRDLDKSIESYRLALEKSPKDRDVALSLAQSYLQKGAAGPALEIYAAQVKATPNDSDLLLGYADAAANAGQTDLAITTYERYLKAEPDSPDVDAIKDRIEQLRNPTPQPQIPQ